MRLVPDEDVHAVFSGEAFDEIAFVLPRPPHDVIGDTDIERAISAACEDVNEIEVVPHAHFSPAVIPGRPIAPAYSARSSGGEGDSGGNACVVQKFSAVLLDR